MDEFKWIEDVVVPETSVDAIEFLKILDEFDKFPSNLFHARGKRLDLLESYMNRIIDIGITNITVADIASSWLTELEFLIEYGVRHGMNKWYQKDVRKVIRDMKKRKTKYIEILLVPNDNYWYNMSAEEMLMKWKR